MKVGDLVKWKTADKIAASLGHPQTSVSGIVVQIRRCKAAPTGDTVEVALVHGGVAGFSVRALEVVHEAR